MSESEGAEARLHAHAEDVLNRAAFRRKDRADLAEELYGHLWQRWQDARAAGLDDDAAADQAIESFGEPARLGREVTLAYHSRLYASTIGVLVPSVTLPNDKPTGYYGPFIILQLAPAMYGCLLGLEAGWTPTRAAVGLVGLFLAAPAAAIAWYAYSARQRWAADFARMMLAVPIIWIGLDVVTIAPMPDLAIVDGIIVLLLVAVAALPRLGLQPLLDWLDNRPVPRRLTVGLSAMFILGSAMPFVALNIPDPTQIGPGDESVALSVACTPDGSGGLSAVDVTAEFSFARTDLWPSGLRGQFLGSDARDILFLDLQTAPVTAGTAAGLLLSAWPTGLDTTAGAAMQIDPLGFGTVGWYLTASTHFVSGHTYRVTWRYTVSAGQPVLEAATLSYDHLERFSIQAKAGCGEQSVGQYFRPPPASIP